MTNNPNAEILTASEFTVVAAKKELGKTLDYSIDSLGDLEALIQHVKSHFLKLKMEGKLTEQAVQSASISIGGYLGEVIRRHHGGTWIAKNAMMKVLIINDQEFSPILYIYQRLIKNSDDSLENYWSEINQKLQPQEELEDQLPVSETSKKRTNRLTGNRSLLVRRDNRPSRLIDTWNSRHKKIFKYYNDPADDPDDYLPACCYKNSWDISPFHNQGRADRFFTGSSGRL